MNKNDIVRGRCISHTYDGLGVVKVDNIPIFVKGLIIDEEAEIRIINMKKSFGYGKLEKLISVNENRSTPKCKLANKCGGCHIQHMKVNQQGKFKTDIVKELMQRIAKRDIKVNNIIDCTSHYYYRNKVQIPIGYEHGEVIMGFYRTHSNQIIDMDECVNQSKVLNEISLYFKSLLKKYKNYSSFRHLLLKHGFNTDEVMVVLIVKDSKVKNLDSMIKDLTANFECIKSVILNINNRDDNVILGDEEKLLYGNDRIFDTIDDIKFSISSKSFYQINPIQTNVLYNQVLKAINPKGNERVLDLYCGVGTISLYLAKHVKEVVGIEIVKEAIDDAKLNATLNNMSNVDFICSDSGEYAQDVAKHNAKFDVIVVDPPRKGLDSKSIDAILRMSPDKIVYVSCDPSTLARDISLIPKDEYRVEYIQPIDMFPNTYHVECVALISKIIINES